MTSVDIVNYLKRINDRYNSHKVELFSDGSGSIYQCESEKLIGSFDTLDELEKLINKPENKTREVEDLLKDSIDTITDILNDLALRIRETLI